MARILAGVRGGVEHLRTPEVMNAAGVAREDVEHRLLHAFGRLRAIVAIVRILRGREEPETVPTSFVREGQHALDRGLGHDDEPETRGHVLDRTVELVEERGA